MVAIEWSRRYAGGQSAAARMPLRTALALGATRHLTAGGGGAWVARDPLWPAVYGSLSGEPTPDLEAPSRDD